MRELEERLPDPEVVLNLAPEELAAHLLSVLQMRYADGKTFSIWNLQCELGGHDPPYGVAAGDVQLAFVEAISWLVGQALIVSAPTSDSWHVLSRRARSMAPTNLATFRNSLMLRKEALEPSIAHKVWSEFVRGEYSTAVFVAMRQVEIEVRRAGGYGDKIIGTDLMRAAFHPDRGPLTDLETVFAERESRMHLFAGAIGAYKNPPSHREVDMGDASEALEVVYLANHLLRIVAARKQA